MNLCGADARIDPYHNDNVGAGFYSARKCSRSHKRVRAQQSRAPTFILKSIPSYEQGVFVYERHQ